MSHAAALADLSAGLVTSVTGKTPNDAIFSRLKESTLRVAKSQRHSRTNPFEVRDRLNGLVEKFAVRDREDLSEALQARLHELPVESKWLPEVLFLFLELSDRPLEKTRLEDLGGPGGLSADLHQPTWEEIIAADPLDEPDLWDDIERGYHSSGDEAVPDGAESQQTASTSVTSFDEEDPVSIAKLHIIQPDSDALKAIPVSQLSKREDPSTDPVQTVSELALIRQMLMTLRGLPADFDIGSGAIRFTSGSNLAVSGIITETTNVAVALAYLRDWAHSSQSIKYLQTIQGTILFLLAGFNSALSHIEGRYASPKHDTVVSVVSVQNEINNLARPLITISSVFRRLPESARYGTNFLLLDAIYEETCVAQMANEESVFQGLVLILLSGLQTYLRDAVQWISTGMVAAADLSAFFVREVDSACERSDLWHKRFELRLQDGNQTFAPRCLSPFIRKIFALGKSKMFLRLLTQVEDGDCRNTSCERPDLERLMRCQDFEALLPLANILSQTLRSWTESTALDQTSQLRSSLLHDHQLLETLSALPYVFFSRNGAAFQGFAEALVEPLSSGNATHMTVDPFLLSELAAELFGSIPIVDARSIILSINKTKAFSGSSMRKLSLIKMEYRFNWAIQNITRCRTSDTHAKVFVLLLQINYASRHLQPKILAFDHSGSGTPASLKLRSALLCFIDTVSYHVTTSASTLHQKVQRQMEAAEDVDTMVLLWAEYTKRLNINLMLTTKLEPMLEAIVQILELCEIFSSSISSRAVQAMQAQFSDTLAFLIAGVRGVSRAGGEAALGAFADRMEWILR